jgi:hypothetical protein
MRTSYGLEISESLRRLQPALRGLKDDVVVADLGHPLSHPGLRSPRLAAEVICGAFHRTFVVIRDDPCLVARTINVLRTAQPAHGEIIVCHQRSGAMVKSITATLEREIPDVPVRDEWRWDEKAALRMGDSGIPMTFAGIERELAL